jgi:hypothetical protein
MSRGACCKARAPMIGRWPRPMHVGSTLDAIRSRGGLSNTGCCARHRGNGSPRIPSWSCSRCTSSSTTRRSRRNRRVDACATPCPRASIASSMRAAGNGTRRSWALRSTSSRCHQPPSSACAPRPCRSND